MVKAVRAQRSGANTDLCARRGSRSDAAAGGGGGAIVWMRSRLRGRRPGIARADRDTRTMLHLLFLALHLLCFTQVRSRTSGRSGFVRPQEPGKGRREVCVCARRTRDSQQLDVSAESGSVGCSITHTHRLRLTHSVSHAHHTNTDGLTHTHPIHTQTITFSLTRTPHTHAQIQTHTKTLTHTVSHTHHTHIYKLTLSWCIWVNLLYTYRY